MLIIEEDYQWWQGNDRRLLKRINILIDVELRTRVKVADNLSGSNTGPAMSGHGASPKNTAWYTESLAATW